MDLLIKAERFCAYQERCKADVQKKLRDLKAGPNEIMRIIASLEEDGYLDEERFARLFAGGKFRIKRWGKNKIRAELKAKKIPDIHIRAALDSIDEAEYLKTLRHLIKKKEREIKASGQKEKELKIYRFLLSKGFEPHLSLSCLKQETEN